MLSEQNMDVSSFSYESLCVLRPAVLVTKSILRNSADGSIIIGARDFSPDSRSAGHLLPYEWLFVIPGCFGNEIQPEAGRNPHFVRSKFAGAARKR